jgi:hypothetical protein
MKNLQTFAFNLGFYYAFKEDEEGSYRSNFIEQREFIKYLNRRACILPSYFSENLTKLFWDCPFHLDGQLLPGVLTPSVASSLVHLSLTGTVEDLGKTDGPFPRKMSFPNFPKLRGLTLGHRTSQVLSVPEFIDSAPNLHVLEMKGMPGLLSDKDRCFWQGSDRESYSNPKHLKLRIFCTDIPLTSLPTLEMISSKFPNLVELRLGSVWNCGLDPFLSSVSSNHSKLQRLSWTYKEKFNLDELFHHLVRVPKLLPSITSYSLGHAKNLLHPHWEINVQEMNQSAKILLDLPLNSDNNYCLINLLIPYLNCDCKPAKSVQVRCKQCYLYQFIRRHSLPIRIPSEREIEEMRRTYRKKHRFENF